MSLQCQSGSDFWRLAKTNFDLALAHASAIREFFADHFALAEKARLNLRMSKAEKLTGKILSGRSDQNFAFDDLCYVIERAGFQLRPGKGSHRIYSITRMALLRLLMSSRGTERRSRIK